MSKAKILGIVGSPRRHSNTEVMVREALKGAEMAGNVETEILLLAGKKINPCNSCFKCKERKDLCIFRFKDDMQEYYENYLLADGLIIGSPVYHLSISGILKNAIDRLGQGILSKFQETGLPWFCKVSGVLAQGAERFGGQEYTMQFLVNHLILMNNIVVSPGGLNAVGVAASLQGGPIGTPGVIGEYDPEALRKSRELGKRVAEITQIMRAGVEVLKETLPDEYARCVLQKEEFRNVTMINKRP